MGGLHRRGGARAEQEGQPGLPAVGQPRSEQVRHMMMMLLLSISGTRSMTCDVCCVMRCSMLQVQEHPGGQQRAHQVVASLPSGGIQDQRTLHGLQVPNLTLLSMGDLKMLMCTFSWLFITALLFVSVMCSLTNSLLMSVTDASVAATKHCSGTGKSLSAGT